MLDTVNKQDADLKLFRSAWIRLHDHIFAKLKNKEDNQFNVSVDFNGKTYQFYIRTENPDDSWRSKKISVLRKPEKKLWFFQISDTQWAAEPFHYKLVGERQQFYPYEDCYMTWEEMFIFLACREDILAKLLYEVEKRNRKETERRTPFEELAEKHKISLEGIENWLKVVPT
jgi:hypothetical protein